MKKTSKVARKVARNKKKRMARKTSTVAPNTIHKYLVKRVQGRKQKVAVIVGTKDNEGIIRIGWSRANINAGDRFNKERALDIALDRMKATEMVPVPPSIVDDVISFQDRCQRYFKDAEGMWKVAVQIQS